MKKCTICNRELDDGITKCPNCGHDFSFNYRTDDKKFRERFVYTKKDMGLICVFVGCFF